MTYPVQYGTSRFTPFRVAASASQPRCPLPVGCYWPTIGEAVDALTPGMSRIARECHAIHGAGYGAILANVLANVSLAAASNFIIRDQKGRPMPLALHIRYAGPPMSGKSSAHNRFTAPVVAAMKGWPKGKWFNNVTPTALLRKIRGGSVMSILSTAEGRGYLGCLLSCLFELKSDLYDGNVPSFDRADDGDIPADAPDRAIFCMCINAQNDAHRKWLARHLEEAIESGYLFRLLMIDTDELSIEGAGAQLPESALLDYDRRIGELVASARQKLDTTAVSGLPGIGLEPEAARILEQRQRHFEYMASAALQDRLSMVFAVRLAANACRIAGCMHVFEGYEGPVSADTMGRAVTIAEFFGAQWLATVFPPKPIPDDIQRAQRLLDYLHERARRLWLPQTSWRKADIEVLAPNFGWSKAQMSEAITLICGWRFAEIVTRIENGRRVIKLELNPSPFGNRPLYLD